MCSALNLFKYSVLKDCGGWLGFLPSPKLKNSKCVRQEWINQCFVNSTNISLSYLLLLFCVGLHYSYVKALFMTNTSTMSSLCGNRSWILPLECRLILAALSCCLLELALGYTSRNPASITETWLLALMLKAFHLAVLKHTVLFRNKHKSNLLFASM